MPEPSKAADLNAIGGKWYSMPCTSLARGVVGFVIGSRSAKASRSDLHRWEFVYGANESGGRRHGGEYGDLPGGLAARLSPAPSEDDAGAQGECQSGEEVAR